MAIATKQKARNTAKKGGVSIGDLLDNVRDAKDAFLALESIDCHFDQSERRLINILVKYARLHAQRIVDSFVNFDKGMSMVRKSAPEILLRDGDKIVLLQDALRSKLADATASYDDIIQAYKAMMAYIPSVSQEAVAALEVIQEEQRQQRRESLAREVLAEIASLDFLN